MAHSLMWMASFFTMAWKVMDFVWFKRKDKDFLQVQSEHCKRLCNVIPRLEKFLKDMEASPKTKVLNRNQCIHLIGKLILVMRGIYKMLSNTTRNLKFQSIFEELDFLQNKIEIIANNCTKQDQRGQAIVFQFQIKETFRELLLDLKCCYDTAWEVYIFHHLNQSNDILPIQFDATTYEQVLEDEEDLKRELELVFQREVSQDYEIAQHLLLRLRNLDRVEGGDLDALEIPHEFKPPKLIYRIGGGSYGDVYKSNWFGLPCATKVLKGDLEYLLASKIEVGILAGLSHPNLVQFFGCGITKKVDENPKQEEIGLRMHFLAQLKKSILFRILKNLIQRLRLGSFQKLEENFKEDENGMMYLVMELMDSNLSSILKKEKGPLPYCLAIDIMLQIAKGVCYLHDMQVAHLDLKPDNVLSSSIPIKDLVPHRIFKIMDYGTCQLEVLSNPKNPKPSEYTIGTQGYMAPEMIKESKAPSYPFRADVWSFGMICSEILSRKVPYYGLKFKEFCDQISYTHGNSGKGLRPELPNNCKELTNLIEECWFQDPLRRPTFSNICEKLISLKKSFLKGAYSCEMVPQFGSPCTFKDSISIIDHVQKVDEQIAPPKEVFVDLKDQLSRAKDLLKLNYIGIVGMGGIGKTTLAKAIFDDEEVKSSYDESCFVAQCKNYQSSYDILYEILNKMLSKLQNDQKPKNLKDAQMIMNDLLLKNKVLLILDDVKDEAQVHNIVPPNIVQASKGTTIIITTREWTTIKSFVDTEGRLDVEFLNDKAATMLFSTHLSWGEGPLSPDFENLCKHVVRACNGLPLSLKVMGSFLHNKERLRSWERALQRMARGRNLDGNEEIWNTLKISYDGLNDGVEKGMFLDVACFFCQDVYPSGITRETILYMWSKDGILPVDELERLIDMSLLKVNEDGGILEMHDQLRDMGRDIAGNTRIWRASMIPKGGFTSKDIETLEGISWQGTMIQSDFEVQEGICRQKTIVQHHQSFDFRKLRILTFVSTLEVSKAYVDNLDSLLQLASQCSQLEVIIFGNSDSSIFQVRHSLQAHSALNILKNRISNLCITHASLKVLDLIGLRFLEHLPNKFASNESLLRLNLNSCICLVALPVEVGNLSSLITLNLQWCSSLVVLPMEIGNLSSLTTLNLEGCSNLVALPMEVGNLSLLTTLNLRRCLRLVALPMEVGNLSSLTILNLEECLRLVALPKDVGNLSFLTTLNLGGCSSLVSLPMEVGNLTSLITLNLNGCSSLAALPIEVGNLSSLITLNLKWCSSLMALPAEVGNLSSLITLNLNGCSSLVDLPVEVEELSSLTTLNLNDCSSLVALPMKVGNLSTLTTLDLRGCSSLVVLAMELGNLTSLATLDLQGCSSLVALHVELGNLSSLTTLSLTECSSMVALPMEVGKLSSLTTLNLDGCLSLVDLSMKIGNLSSLTTLNLDGCSSLEALPVEVGNLTSLTTLNLRRCLRLVALPKEIGNLSVLITLNLTECSSLVTLPVEVGNLTLLTTLDLQWCSSFVALPMEVGNLISLTTLNLEGCSSLIALPMEVENLASLTYLSLWGCSSLVALPMEVWNFPSLTTLYLKKCSSLAILPKKVENLTSLTTLQIDGCLRFVELQPEVWKLTSLTTFELGGHSSFFELPMEIGNLTSLKTLTLDGYSRLITLPKEIGNLTSLIILNLIRCSSLSILPKEVGNLSSLKTLNLYDCSRLETLPNEVGNLSSLTVLELVRCSSLATLPNEVGNLSSLITLNLVGCSSLATLPNEVEKLYQLTRLNLDGCILLSSLPKNLGCLPKIWTLSWENCPNLAPYMLVEMSSPTSLASLEAKFFCLEGDYHYRICCDGCNVFPIVGLCFKAKATFKQNYYLCLECFTIWKISLENPSQ